MNSTFQLNQRRETPDPSNSGLLSRLGVHDSGNYAGFCGPAQLEKDLNTLYGFLKGIEADQAINIAEMLDLKNWASSVQERQRIYPYQILIQKIDEVLIDGIIVEEEIQDLLWLCEKYLDRANPYYDVITSNIQQLTGFLSGITADRVINSEELEALNEWVSESHFLLGTWPFDQLLGILRETIDDRRLTPDLHEELLLFCDTINSITPQNPNSNKPLLVSIQEEHPLIIVPGSTFCLTGESKRYKRREIAEIITSFGGGIQDNISGKLHYLVICDEKNACWAFASYGRKVEKAMQLKAKGAGLSVVYEEHLYEALQELGFVH